MVFAPVEISGEIVELCLRAEYSLVFTNCLLLTLLLALESFICITCYYET